MAGSQARHGSRSPWQVNPFETFYLLGKLLKTHKHLAGWNVTADVITEFRGLATILDEIIMSAVLEQLQKNKEPMLRSDLMQTTAADLGLFDPGQPAASLPDVDRAIDILIRRGQIVEKAVLSETSRYTNGEPARVFILSLPLLDRLALEG